MSATPAVRAGTQAILKLGMTRMRSLIMAAQRLVLGDPRLLARDARHQAWLMGDDDRRFAAQFAPEGRSGSIPFGDVVLRTGAMRKLVIPRDQLQQGHIAVPSGATGSGKTTWAAGFLNSVLDDSGERLLIIDPKGDIAGAFRERYFPARVAGARAGGIEDRIRFLEPFVSGRSVPMRLTQPEAGVARNVQAMSLARAIVEATGIELSLPSVSAFAKLAGLAIELDEPLTAIVNWIG